MMSSNRKKISCSLFVFFVSCGLIIESNARYTPFRKEPVERRSYHRPMYYSKEPLLDTIELNSRSGFNVEDPMSGMGEQDLMKLLSEGMALENRLKMLLGKSQLRRR